MAFPTPDDAPVTKIFFRSLISCFLIIKMAVTKMLHVRVDNELSEDANAIYRSLGLSMSEAIRLFLHRSVVTRGFPHELKVPNATTLEALAEARQMRQAKKARFSSPEELFAELEG